MTHNAFGQPLEFCRREEITEWQPIKEIPGFERRLAGAWRSRGPLKNSTRPMTCDLVVPLGMDRVDRLYFLGVFGIQESNPEHHGAPVATILVTAADGRLIQFALRQGVHVEDSLLLTPRNLVEGDGIEVRTFGNIQIGTRNHRVDLLSLDLPGQLGLKSVKFHDLAVDSSFVLLGAWAESHLHPVGCPFHSSSRGVSLQELASVVRSADRDRFRKAVQQMETSVEATEDVEEQKGLVLTFLSIVVASQLELGAPRQFHSLLLRAARQLDAANTTAEIIGRARELIESATLDLMADRGVHEKLMDQVIRIIDRNYMNDLSDQQLAHNLGLSTSHFRYVFKQSTGMPFHQYVIGLRLERAKQLLVGERHSVQEVAQRVGFGHVAHFSRAFAKRFGVAPSHIRSRQFRERHEAEVTE